MHTLTHDMFKDNYFFTKKFPWRPKPKVVHVAQTCLCFKHMCATFTTSLLA